MPLVASSNWANLPFDIDCGACNNTCYEEDETYILVEHVPVEVCPKCGERLYTPEVTDTLLQFAKQPVKPAKMIHVPVYDFTERAVGL